MLLDPMGGIVMTNERPAVRQLSILREVSTSSGRRSAPAMLKSMIDDWQLHPPRGRRSRDRAVGARHDVGVIVLAGEYLSRAEPLLERQIHPTVICNGYLKALDDAVKMLDELATPLDVNDNDMLTKIVESCTGTKFIARFSNMLVGLSLEAVQTVISRTAGRKEIDIKRYAKVEKIPGGDMEDCRVLKGVMINKDVVHAKMRRRIEKPRILLLDCTLEYKKGESQTQIELSDEKAWEALLQEEENAIKEMCNDIIAVKPDLVVTEKGVSDLAQHYLQKANISVLRRVRKTDNNRIARATGATIVHRTSEIQEKDLGLGAGLFNIEKIGDEYYAWIVDCESPKACTIVLRGASKDVLNEIERNLGDAMNIVRTIMMDPRLVPGGGAIEMTLANKLIEASKVQEPVIANAYKAAGESLEIISRTLLENCGADIIRVQTQLRAKHAGGANLNLGHRRREGRARRHGGDRRVGARRSEAADDQDGRRERCHALR